METERSKEWVLDRVRKLLTLANNAGATEGERDNAMRMAHKLLAKYNLDQAEVEAATGEQQERRGVGRGEYYGRPWARVVSASIAKLFFCEYLYMPATRARQTSHYFIGRESNVITAKAMAQYVVESIQREGRRRNRQEGTGENIWLRSFCMGAASVIALRVEEMIRESANESTTPGEKSGTAIVLASVYETERQANLAVRDEKFGKLRKGRSGKSDYSDDATIEGARYGRTVSLNRQIGDSTPTRKRLT